MRMKISDFIQNQILRPRLTQAGVLAVYDPAHRCPELCLALNTEDILVVDASGSRIPNPPAPQAAFPALGKPGGAAGAAAGRRPWRPAPSPPS